MAVFNRSFDVLLGVYQSQGAGSLVGLDSQYTTVPHVNTGNTIQGFVFDKASWKTEEQFNSASYTPTGWDAKTSTLDDSFFQSGIGDDEDLEVQLISVHHVDNRSLWLPRVNHGHFYINRNESYLLSDDSVTQYTTLSGTAEGSNANFVTLDFTPKSGIPIVVRQWEWDSDTNKYLVHRDFQNQLYFTGVLDENNERLETWVDPSNILWENVDPNEPEYLVDSGTNLFLNDQYNDVVGTVLSSTVGLTTSGLQEDWDFVGTATGEDFEEFHLTYSPVDKTQPAQLIIDDAGSFSLIDLVDNLTSGVFDEAALDRDLGIVTFGDVTIGGVLASGNNVYAAYTKAVSIEYEPIDSRDYIENSPLADTNLVRKFSDGGFIFIQNSPSDTVELNLTTDLGSLGGDTYGPLYIGNEFATLIAEALDANGLPVESELITFEILDPVIGTFGSATETVQAITNAEGLARTLYNAPRTIDDVGVYTNQLTNAGTTTMIAPGLFPREDTSLYVYQVQREDSILGIAESGLLNFYESYILEEGVEGPVLSFDVSDIGDYSWIAGAYADLIKWEIFHRLFSNLPSPVVYPSDDISTGKKLILTEFDGTAINPHTGSAGAFVPVQPDSFTVTATGSILTFSPTIGVVTPSTFFKSYFVAGGTQVQVRASAYNERLGRTIYSNIVTIEIDIPDSMNGLVEIAAINDAPEGLLGNADYYHQTDYSLDPVTITSAGVLPLGFRLRSRGISLASALSALTFFDINAEVQFIHTPTLRHEFRVDI